jgi:hypothetical protein
MRVVNMAHGSPRLENCREANTAMRGRQLGHYVQMKIP